MRIRLCLIFGAVLSMVTVAFATPPTFTIRRGGTLTAKGMAGGSVDGAKLREGCVGFVGNAPNHVLRALQAGAYVVRIDSPQDLTLIIVGPKETYCNDDYGPKKIPSEIIPTTGLFKIYVGSKDGKPYPYTMTIEDAAG